MARYVAGKQILQQDSRGLTYTSNKERSNSPTREVLQKAKIKGPSMFLVLGFSRTLQKQCVLLLISFEVSTAVVNQFHPIFIRFQSISVPFQSSLQPLPFQAILIPPDHPKSKPFLNLDY